MGWSKYKKIPALLLAVLMLLELLCLPVSAAKADQISLSTDKTVYRYGEDIVVTATGNANCWVGIYKKGESYGSGSGTVASFFWYYVNRPNDANGRTNGEPTVIQDTTSNKRADVLPEGEYVVYLFESAGGNEYVEKLSVSLRIQDASLEPLTSIRYELANPGDGFANGTVTVTKSAANGATDCRMYWADAQGRPLEGYAPLAKFKLTDTTTVFRMYSHTVIPAGARQLIAYAVKNDMLSETAVAAVLPQGSDYQPAGTLLGQFQLISDTHVTTGSDTATHNAHFAQFLADVQANAGGSMGIFINGDVTDSGKEEEYKKLVNLYDQAKKKGSLPGLHLAIGNHDWNQGNPNSLFQRYAKALNPNLTAQPEKVYYAETVAGYTFIYLGSEQSGTGATLSNQQLEWLDAQLAEAAQADPGKPVFVLLHQAMYNTVAGTLPGQGWHGVNNEAALKKILMKYPQVIIAGGHSHWEMDSPRCLYPGDAGMSVALNTASVGYLWSDYHTAGGVNYPGSHGYYVRLYEDRVEVLGREFESGLYLPSAMFVIRRNAIQAEESYTVALGGQLDLGISALDGGALTYVSSDASVAEVSDGGVVSGKKLGTVTVTITAPATDTTVVDRKTVTVTVVDAHSCADGNKDHYCDGCGKKLTEHTPGKAVRENEKAASCTAEGSYDEVVRCTVCNTELSRNTQTIGKLAHTPGEAVRENEKAASCTAEGSYDEVVLCAVCNTELSRNTQAIGKLAHTPGEALRENEKAASCTAEGSYDEVVRCAVCNTELSRNTQTIGKLAHTPGEAVRENERAATCTAAGSYEEVVRCTVCGGELSRTPKTTEKAPHADKTGDGNHACDSCGRGNITLCADDDGNNFCDECGLVMCVHVDESPRDHVCDKCGRAASVCADGDQDHRCDLCGNKLTEHIPGKAVRENEKAASCAAEGSYDEVVYCSVCHGELSRTAKTIGKLAHTPGEAVRENEKAATCAAEGSYDEAVYCSVCHGELSRTAKTIGKLDHTPGEAVRENEKAATCAAEGSYDEVVYCSVCHGELSRTAKTIGKLAHTPGEAVRENEKAATCAAEGSYDEVVYCTGCGEELSRVEKTLEQLGHEDGNRDHLCDGCGRKLSDHTDGNADYTCDLCGKELEKPEEPEAPVEEVIRLAGENRFDTAIQVAEEMKRRMGLEQFDTVILASGNEFADALAGSYLAAVKGAPILLCWNGDSRFNYLNGQVVSYIKENLAAGGKVYILGGTAAVPESLELALGRYEVERLAGANRFETNLLILEEAGVKAGEEILVCTATNFADSLSASATGKPILLVFNEYGKLYGRQPEFLASLKNCTFTVIGGENAVSHQLAGEILAYGGTNRLAGSNRFETSVLVARKYFDQPERMVLAYAWNYPDGLCGGALAYAMGVPLVLTMTKYEDKAAAYANSNGIRSGIVLGGEGLISDASVDLIFQKYRVQYVLNGGTNHPDNPEVYFGPGTLTAICEPSRAGYVFQGWYLESGFQTRLEALPAGYIGDLTLYARWSLEGLNINGVGLDNMIWSWWYYPQVVSTEDAVYWGYATKEGYCGVASYDFQTGETVKNALKLGTVADDHNGLSLTVLDDGRIVCVYAGGHDKDRDMHIRISEKPGDIRNFDTHIVLQSSGKTCYGQILKAQGRYYLFYRINNGSWSYRSSADCVNWGEETVVVTSNMQYYCKFMPTTQDGLIRICMYSNPSAADPRIRMGFLDVTTGKVLDGDCKTVLGTQQISYDRFRVLIDQPEGMVQRMFDVAISEPLSPRILYCRFTNKKGTADSTYYLYNAGETVEICKGGAPLMDPKYQLGASFVDGDTIAVGRNADGKDYMELYDYGESGIRLTRTLNSQSAQDNYRNARPIVDVNGKVILWHCGYYNPKGYTEFATSAKLYRLDTGELIAESEDRQDAQAMAQVKPENVDAVKVYAQRLYRENTQSDYIHANFSWDLADRSSTWIYFTGLMYEAFLETDFDAYNGEIRAFFNQHIAADGKIGSYIAGELDSALLPAVMLRLLNSGVLTETEETRYAAAAGYVYRQLEKQTVYPEAGNLWLHSQKADGTPRPAWTKWNICLDGVYMSQMFLIRLAEAIDNGKVEIVDSRGQLVTSEQIWEDVYSRLRFVMGHFRDETSGLLYHGYSVGTGETNEAFWSRGIGWYAMVLMEAAEKCPDPEKKAVLVADFGKLMTALVRWQDFETFLWYNVTDGKEEYFYQNGEKTVYNMPESSGSAMFAYCLLKGFDSGLLKNESYRAAGLRAFNALAEGKLTEEGLTDIYASSSVTSNKNLYQKNGYVTGDGKGVGPLILASNYVG